MSFAPILDPSAYTSRDEPRRRTAVAAAGILQRLAMVPEKLRTAILLLASEPSTEAPESSALQAMLLTEGVVPSSAVMHPSVLQALRIQLANVKSFCEMDEGGLDTYLECVCRYIRSGRVELFAGAAARPS